MCLLKILVYQKFTSLLNLKSRKLQGVRGMGVP